MEKGPEGARPCKHSGFLLLKTPVPFGDDGGTPVYRQGNWALGGSDWPKALSRQGDGAGVGKQGQPAKGMPFPAEPVAFGHPCPGLIPFPKREGGSEKEGVLVGVH